VVDPLQDKPPLRDRNVRRILVRINASLPPEAKKNLENLTMKWCILKYL